MDNNPDYYDSNILPHTSRGSENRLLTLANDILTKQRVQFQCKGTGKTKSDSLNDTRD